MPLLSTFLLQSISKRVAELLDHYPHVAKPSLLVRLADQPACIRSEFFSSRLIIVENLQAGLHEINELSRVLKRKAG